MWSWTDRVYIHQASLSSTSMLSFKSQLHTPVSIWVVRGFAAEPPWIKLHDAHSEMEHTRSSLLPERKAEVYKTWAACWSSQKEAAARLASQPHCPPWPALPTEPACLPAQRRLAACPCLHHSLGRFCKPHRGQLPNVLWTILGPFWGSIPCLDEQSHVVFFPWPLLPRKTPSATSHTLGECWLPAGGHRFHRVCGSPQP